MKSARTTGKRGAAHGAREERNVDDDDGDHRVDEARGPAQRRWRARAADRERPSACRCRASAACRSSLPWKAARRPIAEPISAAMIAAAKTPTARLTPRAPDETREDVAADLVRAENMAGRQRRREAMRDIGEMRTAQAAGSAPRATITTITASSSRPKLAIRFWVSRARRDGRPRRASAAALAGAVRLLSDQPGAAS